MSHSWSKPICVFPEYAVCRTAPALRPEGAIQGRIREHPFGIESITNLREIVKPRVALTKLCRISRVHLPSAVGRREPQERTQLHGSSLETAPSNSGESPHSHCRGRAVDIHSRRRRRHEPRSETKPRNLRRSIMVCSSLTAAGICAGGESIPSPETAPFCASRKSDGIRRL